MKRSRTPALRLIPLLALSLSSGCAHLTRQSNSTPAPPIQAETRVLKATPQAQQSVQLQDPVMLYRDAEAFYEQSLYGEVVVNLTALVRDFPDSRYRRGSMILLGMAEEKRGRTKEASDWYTRYLQEYPQEPLRWTAWRGLTDLSIQAARWDEARQQTEQWLQITGLPAQVTQAAQARQGAALVELNKMETAQPLLQQALKPSTPDDSLAGLLDPAETAAIARYYLGEMSRKESEAITLDGNLPAEQLAADMEEKATHLLEAHRQYYRALSYGMPEWTSKAAYQMGYLYERYYADVVEAPLPAGLTPEEQAQYQTMVKEQLVNVAGKAVTLYQQVLRYAETLSLDPAWVQQCRDGLTRLQAYQPNIPLPKEPDKASTKPARI